MMQSPSKPTEPSQQTEEFIRREPAYLNETGLDAGFVANLALKALYYRAHPSTTDLSETLALSIPVIQEVMTLLTRDGLAETIPGEGQGPASYRYSLTSSGMVHAAAALERNAYVGPAPVPFDEYIAQVRRQSAGGSGYSRTVVSEALAQLVLSRDTLDRVGRAIYSGRPTLIHGHSGNGKTTIASLLGQAMAGDILIPHAVEVYGHIVRVFDPSKHRPANGAAGGDGPTSRRWDRRWAIVKRPAIMAGGELTRHSLELVLDQRSKVYEAPLQLKANGGILIIDDFGRQQIPAAELLNRWIVALEGGVDHLSLHTGQTIAVPYTEPLAGGVPDDLPPSLPRTGRRRRGVDCRLSAGTLVRAPGARAARLPSARPNRGGRRRGALQRRRGEGDAGDARRGLPHILPVRVGPRNGKTPVLLSEACFPA
ncbi:MAG: ATP-binding protein [Dehalococcoidia bacterium]